jgi:hypothetical protein
MMEAVHRFEGTVNQVLGDGIMALFGAPIAHEDHAARACYAALAMQTAMQPYAEEVRRSHGITMGIRVGLNSGEVVVRTIGNDLHMDYSAVGQTTNLASRMEQLAAPGSVVLTAATLRLVEGLVRVNDLGPIPVKGMSEPVEVYELTGASSVRRRLQAAVTRGLTKFVGRDREIDTLNQALEQAGSGHGQMVAAVGEAGVGKSRLVYEFVHSHRTQGWLVLESASVSYGKATPYFPVIDLLKHYIHIEDGDDARTIRAKVTGQILTLDESLQDTIPPLLSLLDALPEDSPFLKLDPPQRRQRTLDGLKRILLRENQVQPLVLVFEDCIGTIMKAKRCSTAWWRVCPRPNSCSWSTTARNTPTVGEAKLITPSSDLTHYHPKVLTSCWRLCWGTTPVCRRSSNFSLSARKGIHSFWKRVCGCWWKRRC